jgi:ABC-2 type transport system ATP-binding protein
MINRGRLQKLDSPQALIRELGEFTVDETGEGDLKSTHFATREEAIRYLESTGSGSVLRQTTLEDVFIDVAGRKLQ